MLKLIFYLFTYKISNNYIKYVKLYDLKDNDNNIYNNINDDINNIINNTDNIMNNTDNTINNITSYDVKKNSLVKQFYKNLCSGMDHSKENLNYNPINNSYYVNNSNSSILSEYNLTDEIIFRNNVNLYKMSILNKLISNISIINKLNYIENYNKYFNNTISGYNIYNGNLMKDWNFDF